MDHKQLHLLLSSTHWLYTVDSAGVFRLDDLCVEIEIVQGACHIKQTGQRARRPLRSRRGVLEALRRLAEK